MAPDWSRLVPGAPDWPVLVNIGPRKPRLAQTDLRKGQIGPKRSTYTFKYIHIFLHISYTDTYT